MHRLPPELRLLILQEMERGSSRNCSLASKSWRDLCLPVLFRGLKPINVISIAQLQACNCLLTNSPHLRPHVRKVTFICPHFPAYVDDQKKRMVESILLRLPRLKELKGGSILSATLSSVLPQLSITKLHLRQDKSAPLDLLSVLKACASTLRSLILQGLTFGDELTRDGVTIKTGGEYVSMSTLEEVAIVSCVKFPPTSRLIQMPNLKLLYYEGKCAALGECIPSPLKTLVLHDAEVPVNFKTLNVDNICLRMRYGTEPVEHMVNMFTVPSKINHIEILLTHPGILFDGTNKILTQLEEYVLDLHRSGSLERLTITVEFSFDNLGAEFISQRLPILSSLGLLDVRMRRPSVLYLRCTRFGIKWDGN